MQDEAERDRWWEGYFDERFLQIYRALLPDAEAEEEVEAVVAALDLDPPARVLDLACGWGRHAVPLARFGFEVTGLDLSEVLLREARLDAAAARVDIDWVRGDMRNPPLTGGFDAVVSLFSSFGYGGADEDDLAVLRAVRQLLRPGGQLLLETMHRDLVAREFAERDWWPGPDGEPVLVEREFDPVRGVSREWLRWGGVEKYHTIRVRAASEWKVLFEQAGLTADAWYGGWELEPFSVRSERLLIVASPT